MKKMKKETINIIICAAVPGRNYSLFFKDFIRSHVSCYVYGRWFLDQRYY